MEVKVDRSAGVYINGKAVENPVIKFAIATGAILFVCLVVALVALIILPVFGVVLTGAALLIGFVVAVIMAIAVWILAPVVIFSAFAWLVGLFKRR